MIEEDIVVIGSGAAGCFAAAICKEIKPGIRVRILEKTQQPLAKVKISGGGRCNVTHHCFDPLKLSQSYPRGQLFLRGAFSRFQPQDMIDWLEKHGVALKTEKDGRMFPMTNRSETIIECFLSLLKREGVTLSLGAEVVALSREKSRFRLRMKNGEEICAKKVLIATGGVKKSYALAESVGHQIISPVPSLFTFEIEEEWVKRCSGFVAPQAKISLEGFGQEIEGPILMTHWGLSGPATLKLSAFAARWLFDRAYSAKVLVNWVGKREEEVQDILFEERKLSASKKVKATALLSLSKNFWHSLLLQVSPSFPETAWSQVSRQDLRQLVQILVKTELTLVGKSLNKEEFVTCGGISLDEVHSKTLESKKAPGLFFAGEILDIDGVTGGFNFQNAWTSGYLAANAMVASL